MNATTPAKWRLLMLATLVAKLAVTPSSGQVGVDPSFNPDFGVVAPSISTIARQPNGQILVAGRFFEPVHEGIVRLNPNGSRDMSFASTGIPAIRGIRPRPDGKSFIFGSFPVVGEVARAGLARLHANGALDESFYPAIGGDVFQVVTQPDGRILVAGSFTYDSRNLARLDSDGWYDPGFAVGTGASQSAVTALAVQGDGKIVAGGMFTEFDGHPARHLVRLHANGAVDSSFQPDFAIEGLSFPAVHEIICLSDGKLLINANINLDPGVYQQRWLRLKADGTIDASFAPATYLALPAVVQANGRLLGGNPLVRIEASGAEDESFAPISVTGMGGGPGTVTALALEPDGGILVAGLFGKIGNVDRPGLARITNEADAAGSIDFAAPYFEVNEGEGRVMLRVQRVGGSHGHVSASYASTLALPNPTYDISPVSGQIYFADGEAGEKLIELPVYDDRLAEPDELFTVGLANPLGGATLGSVSSAAVLVRDDDINFSFAADWLYVWEGGGAVSVTVQRTGRLGPTGVRLRTYELSAKAPSDFVETGYWISFAQGEVEKTIDVPIRDDPWGELDEQFELYLWQPVNTELAVEADKAMVTIVDDDRPGSVDRRFDPGAGPRLSNGIAGSLWALLIQEDGKIVVGGRFHAFDGVAGGGIARLLPDGSVDPGFNVGAGVTMGPALPGEPGSVASLAVQPDGKLLVGGLFWDINGHSRTGIARLNPDGSVDTSFDPGVGLTDDATSERIGNIVVQPDGCILLAWSRTRPNATGAPPLYGVARLLADGTRDATFGENGLLLVEPVVTWILGRGFSLGVGTLALQPDGRILVGGQIKSIQGTPAPGIARLLPDGSVDLSFNIGSGTLPPYADQQPGMVKVVKRLPDGRLVVGGTFVWLNDRWAPSLGRLFPDGSIDPTFHPQIGRNGAEGGSPSFDNLNTVTGIGDLAVLPDGRMLFVGSFNELNADGGPFTAGPQILRVARIDPNGTLDAYFRASITARRLAVHPDGGIYVIGDFAGGIARLNGGNSFLVRSVTRQSESQMRLTIEVPVAHDYLLMSSSDLATWRPRQILVLTAGVHEVDVPLADTPGREFFQLLALEQ